MITESNIRMGSIAPADAAELAAVHVRAWRQTYDGLLPKAVLGALSVGAKTEMWANILRTRQDQLLTGVWREGALVGFVNGGPVRTSIEGSDVELYAIYLLREAQGLGFGRHLIEAFYEYARAGRYRIASLLVLKDNPAAAFYEKIGWRRGPDARIELDGRTFIEHGYTIVL